MIKDYDTQKFEQFNNTKDKDNVENFHKERIAFIILNNKILYLRHSKLSHLQWANSIGISETDFNSLTRGYILNNNVVFYKGNFDFDKQVLDDAMKFAKTIKLDCNLNNVKVYAGLIAGKPGTIYPPKQYLFDL